MTGINVALEAGALNSLKPGEVDIALVTDAIEADIAKRSVSIIEEDHNGRLVIGSFTGLYVENPVSGEFFPASSAIVGLQRSYIQSIARDERQNLWLATSSGFARFDDSNNSLNQVKAQDSIVYEQPVRALHHTRSGKIWLGGDSKALFEYNPETGQLRPFELPGEIPKTTYIEAILSDAAQRLWISTSNGLLRLDDETGEVHVFRRSDGLQSDRFVLHSAAKGADGKLYFGGRMGLNRFYPNRIKLNDIAPGSS